MDGNFLTILSRFVIPLSSFRSHLFATNLTFLSVILFSFLKVVAVAVFLALGFAFYVFFAPFVGKKIFQYVMIGIYTPLVSSLPIVLLYAMFYLLFCIMV